MMKAPEDTPESELTRAQLATREKMLLFLDELTALSRRYGIYISSEGNLDVPSLRAYDAGRPHHYIPFWREQFSYPMDFIFEEQVDPHLIDI